MSEEKTSQYLASIAWRFYPHLFAHKASRGKWVPYNYLRYIAVELTNSVLKGGARYIVTLPPRHGKSEFISNWFPTWYLYNFPQNRIILASYAAEFASKWGSKVKENLTDNPLIQIELSKSTKAKKNFMTREGGGMMTAGMGGPITGSGANLFIIDDPIKNWQEAQSSLLRERHKDWFRSVAMTRLEPNASIVILQTRWHEDDLSGWLLSSKEEGKEPWTLINFPALAEDDSDILGRSKEDALCVERYSKEHFFKLKKDLGEMIFAALYQQRPSSLEGNLILKDWLKYYDKLPDKIDEEIITADLSFKDGKQSDYTVIQKWSREGSNLYLVDQIRGQMGFPDQVKAIQTMAGRYPLATTKIIEEAANGAAVIEFLKNEIMGLIPIKPHTSKEARLAAVSPLFQAGNVHLPDPKFNSWVDVLISELLTFPNAKNDDCVDATIYAVSHMGKASSSVQALEALGRW